MLVLGVVASGSFLTNSSVSADGEIINTADTVTTVTVPVSCTIDASSLTPQVYASIPNGTYQSDIRGSSFRAYCNDDGGFAIYAVGFSDDLEGNTFMRDAGLGQTYEIQTGTQNSGPTSGWALKIDTLPETYQATISGSQSDPLKQVGDTDYSTWANIPSIHTRVAYRASATDVNLNPNAEVPALGTYISPSYAVYISPTQPSGSYLGQVKYTMVHPFDASAPTSKYYMQRFTASMCQNLASDAPIIVYDKRDEKDYTVRYINGACWMTQNLRISGTISASESNFTGSDVNITQCDLDSSVGECGDITNRSSYTIPMTHDSGSSSLGVWYNYAAATAGTITGGSNDTDASQDICPSGWRLPTNDANNSSAGSVQSLSSSLSDFTPTSGGSYDIGGLYTAGWGFYWTNNGIGPSRNYLRYDNTTTPYYNYYTRNAGFYVRCMRTS